MSTDESRPFPTRRLFLGTALVAVPLAAVAAILRPWLWPPRAEEKRENPKSVAYGRDQRSLPPSVHFSDITRKAGITFRHTNGAFGKKLLPETMGSGVAFIDYDQDGHQDLLFVNSCYWPGFEAKGKSAPTLALYRNDGHGNFTDVTREVGLDLTLYGIGVTVGDYDNDGWPDLFIAAVGGNRLFRNVSDGKKGRRFEDVTTRAGVGGPGAWPKGGDFLKVEAPVTFSSSAAFLDYDGDGRLDLFVCNYVTWSPKLDLDLGFKLAGHGRAYGRPSAFDGAHCFLYRNRGDGTFEDVSAKAGLHVPDVQGRPLGKSLGVIVYDADQDGWPDIFVANDTVRNFFFHNKGDGTFEEMGEQMGVAYAEGNARGAMGTDRWEYSPGSFALAVGNFANEPDTYLLQDGPHQLAYSDAAVACGIAGPSRMLLKFGLFFFDYDLDGRMDLLTCNGHLEPEIALVQAEQTYQQPAQLFWNAGDGRFEDVKPAQAGSDLFLPLVGRGCAFADIDGDGALDVVLTENGGPARLLRNEGGTGNHWVRLALEGDGKRSNRSAIGARVTVEVAGLPPQCQQVTSGRGYLSQSELPLTFGLGKADKVKRVTIQWPGRSAGPAQVLTDLAVNRTYPIRQASAR
jgi:hypothetical protein